MVGRTRKSDVKSRLGKRESSGNKPKSGRIRDARDILRKKVTEKARGTSKTTNLNTKDRVRRLMPLGDLLSATKKKKMITFGGAGKDKLRTFSLSSGSLRVTTKQPDLCRKTVVSKNSLKVVTPTKTVAEPESSSSGFTTTRTGFTTTRTGFTTTRTLTNDLCTRERRSPMFSAAMDDDLRTSSPVLSYVTQDRPMLRTPLRKPRQDTNQRNLTKIVVTNLHPRVVQEDIAELFGAVGPLTSVKLDNCVAEVIFAKADHADLAYQKYHNRMLDGEAMKCTLGLAYVPPETPKQDERMNYSGADLVYPQTPSRPVVFQVRI